MAIQRLSKGVSAGIVSTSSIRSQILVLKELIENSVDAILENQSDSNKNVGQIEIEIDKETAGLEYLSVSDNGPGIDKLDRNLLCLNHTTSKINSKDDFFNGVTTCGFRGEALNFIAGLSQRMSICTRTCTDKMQEYWTVGRSGLSNSDSKFLPGVFGTTIKLNGIFKSTPVRYKFLKESRQKILKDLEILIMTFALIYRPIRFQLKFVKLLPGNRTQLVDKKTFPSRIERIQLLSNLLGLRKQEWLFQSEFRFEVGIPGRDVYNVRADIIFPLMKAESLPTSNINLKIVTINHKPMNLLLKFGKKVASKVNETYKNLLLLVPPTWYISFEIPPKLVDLNIEPEKSDILILNEMEFIEKFAENFLCVIREKHNDFNIERSETSVVDEEMPQNEILNFGDDFNLSDDEDLIETLETTLNDLKNIQKQSADKEQNHLHTVVVHDESDDTTLKRTCNINDKGTGKLEKDDLNRTEKDKEWSRSVYSDSTFSSDIDIPQKTVSQDEFVPTQKTSTELNPWSILELSKEIKDSTKETAVTNTTTNTKNNIDAIAAQNLSVPPIKDVDLTLVDADYNIASNLSKISNNTKTMKQTSISRYGTYQIKDDPLKRRVLKTPIKAKLSEMSQDTLNKSITTEFKLSVDLFYRAARIIQEEDWVYRKGVPSEQLKQFADGIYYDISYTPACEEPRLTGDGIFQFK